MTLPDLGPSCQASQKAQFELRLKASALKNMTQALWRQLGKEASFRVGLWRDRLIESRWTEKILAQEIQFLGMRGDECEHRAIRTLKAFATRLLKGNIGVMLRLWKLNYLDYKEAANRATLTRRLHGRMKEAALTNLQKIMHRREKGGLAGRLVAWRQRQLGLGGVRRVAVEAMSGILDRARRGNFRAVFGWWSQVTQEAWAVSSAKSRLHAEMTDALHQARKTAGETMCRRIALRWGLATGGVVFQLWRQCTLETQALVAKQQSLSLQRKGQGMAGMAAIMARITKGRRSRTPHTDLICRFIPNLGPTCPRSSRVAPIFVVP